MADPFDAARIEMGDGIASPKPSTTNLRGWMASRKRARNAGSDTPCRHPVPYVRGWIAGGAALADCAE